MISPIYIKILQEAHHIYIDATFLSTKDFYQPLIVMAYNSLLNIKIPIAFILMNTKHEKSYELVFKSLLYIITIENTVKLNLISLTTDFEKSITNAVKKVFNNILHIGCLFHFVKNLRLNLLKIGLINNEIIHITDELLKDLSSTPFRINDNPIIIEDIFEKYEKIYNNTDY